MAINIQLRLKNNLYLFNFELRFLLCCLCGFILCCLLGYWQIYRYYYKKSIQDQYQINNALAPQPFNAQTVRPFQKVIVKGRYLKEKEILWQNRFHAGKVGIDVLTPFEMAGEKKLLLVDRGWLQHKEDARKINREEARQTNREDARQIKGQINFLEGYSFILGRNILNKGEFPLQIQKIDFDELKGVMERDFFPFILYLDQAQAPLINALDPQHVQHAQDSFVTLAPQAPFINALAPSRHLGYAIQWFVLAIVCMMGYLGFSFDKTIKIGTSNKEYK